MSEPRVTEQLAEFVESFTIEDLPSGSYDLVKMALKDSLGCAIYGSQLPWVEATRDFASELGEAGNASSATVWGAGQRLPAANAAMVNGTATHAFELDDLHATAVIHPGAEIIPAVLALAEGTSASGRSVVESIAAGYEVGCRVGAATGPEQLKRGWHPSATSGAVGAAAAAAKLLGLTGEQTLHAIAIGATQASGLMSAQYGASVKRWHLGRASQAGVYAALMASHGLTGARSALESSYGGFVAAFAPESDPARIVEGLGEQWEIDRVGFKAFSCCGSSQTSVEAVRQLMRENPVEADRVTRVDVRLSTSSALHVGWPYEPNGQTAAQMNLPYAVAAQLTDGEVFVDQFAPERIEDPYLVELSRKVVCTADPHIDELGNPLRHTAKVTIYLEDQQPLSREVRHRPGSHEEPLGDDRVEEKFRRLVTTAFDQGYADRLSEAISLVDQAPDAETLLGALAAPPTRAG
jgi:2-methylcitrate dehydratase PrpD